MSRIIVNIEALDNVLKNFDAIRESVNDLNNNFHSTVERLDWDVKCMMDIDSRTRSLHNRLNRLYESMSDYWLVLMYAVAEYPKLNHYDYAIKKVGVIDTYSLVTLDEKKNFIDEFETKNPDIKESFDRFLCSGEYNDLSEEEKLEIKYRAYNAKEPARTIFLRRLDNLKLKTTDTEVTGRESGSGSYYNGNIKRQDISLTRKNGHEVSNSYGGNEDDRYDYQLVFHESGHAIDDLSDLVNGKRREHFSTGHDTEKYKSIVNIDGKDKSMTIKEAILYDIYDNVDNPYSLINFYNEYKTEDMGTFKNFKNAVISGKKYEDEIPGYREFLYGNVAVYDDMYCISDIYGGATNNTGIIRTENGAIGHDVDYWKDDGQLAAEAWAHYFEGQFIQDDTYLENMKKYLPTACKVMDSYAADLAKKAKPINV